MKKYINAFNIGLLFFVLYIVQYLFGLKWNWLYELQTGQDYRRWSGLVLGVFIFFQWLLTFTRVIKKLKKYSQKWAVLHKWVGVLSAPIFYAHSMEFGYAYLLLFSLIFFVNIVLGTVNLDVIKSQKEWVFQSWMISHVAMSLMITLLMVFHIGVVFYYK